MGMTYCTLPSPRVIRGKTNAGGRARYGVHSHSIIILHNAQHDATHFSTRIHDTENAKACVQNLQVYGVPRGTIGHSLGASFVDDTCERLIHEGAWYVPTGNRVTTQYPPSKSLGAIFSAIADVEVYPGGMHTPGFKFQDFGKTAGIGEEFDTSSAQQAHNSVARVFRGLHTAQHHIGTKNRLPDLVREACRIKSIVILHHTGITKSPPPPPPAKATLRPDATSVQTHLNTGERVIFLLLTKKAELLPLLTIESHFTKQSTCSFRAGVEGRASLVCSNE